MPLDKNVLSALMIAKLEAQQGGSPIDAAQLKKFTDGMAEAIVTHITTAAVVQPGSFNVALVPVTGTGTVT